MTAKTMATWIPGCTVLLCALILSPASNAASLPARGIFALYPEQMGINQGIYASPNVDGVSLHFSWNAIQPESEVFNWSKIDAEINAAHRYGKKVSLSFFPGAHTPGWVYSAGARSFGIIWEQPFGGFAKCSQQRIPIPWDTTYLSQWTSFIRKVGQRYSADPAVVYVALTGFNAYSVENILPHSGMMPRGRSVCSNVPDYNAQWMAVGYSRDKVLSAWMTIADAFARSFPNQWLVSSITPVAFPAIAGITSSAQETSGYGGDMGSGRFSPSGRRPMMRHDLALEVDVNREVVERYGSRVILMNGALNAVRAWKPGPDLAKVPIAYQTLTRVSRDAKCAMDQSAAPCNTRAVLQAALNNGIDAGAVYIEVYAIDILSPDLQDIMAEARSRLKARVQP